jgi:hypothetical protein
VDEILSEPYPHVPDELKALNNWVGWKLEERDGKPTKVPYARPGVMASSTDPTTWASFNDVCNIPPTKEKGIGFVFDGNGIVGIDLDHCLDEKGKVCDKFSNLAYILNSYTEISPSGTGLHIFVRCESAPYETGKKKGDLEIYSKGRYFTVTGNKLPDSPNTINTFSVELIRSLCDPFVNPEKKEVVRYISSTSTTLSDDEIVTIASRAKNGSRFQDLMNGKSCGDKSSDDLALANILAFYSSDVNQIERIMRMSGLVREKWDRRDYMVNYTIMKAINECTGHYEPPASNGDTDHGKEVSAAMVSQPGKTPPPKKPELSEREIDDIIAASHLCDNLPPFPMISHPFFKKWMLLGMELMYSHPSYHFGNLLAISSMALGRRVGVLIATNYVNTNVNVMLVGTSTISGKSFSSDTAVKEFGISTANIPSLLNPTDATELKRKSCSNPRLIQDMSKRNNMFWYYDEAKEFFDDCGDRGWNAPIVGTLCTAYDGGYLERSLSTRSNSKKGKEEETEENKWICENPFLTLLFNMTISQLQEASTPKIVGSGFFYRWMWFLENGGEKKKNVTASDDDIRQVTEIREELLKVGSAMKMLGPNDICFNVNDKVEQWSLDISKKSDDEIYQSATGRCVIQIYKISMIFAMFDPEFQKLVLNPEGRSSRLEIPDKWVDEAIMIVEKYLLPRMMVVANYSKRVDLNNKQQKVLNALIALKGVSDHTTLLRKTKLDATDFNKAISTLEQSEDIRHVVKGSKTIYCVINHKD